MERGLTGEVMTLDHNIQYSNTLFVTYTGENMFLLPIKTRDQKYSENFDESLSSKGIARKIFEGEMLIRKLPTFLILHMGQS